MKKIYVNADVEFVTFMTADVIQASVEDEPAGSGMYDATTVGETGGKISIGGLDWQ